MTLHYIPAASHHALTPLYDIIVRFTTPELQYKQRLLDLASIEGAQRVLDVGCGTGTLLALAAARSRAALFGIDPDARALTIARRKLKAEASRVLLHRGSATALPYASGSFDRVLTSLMIHHLYRDEKEQCFREIRRVLRPGGELHLVDFGPPDSRAMKAASMLMRLFAHGEARENFSGKLPSMMTAAGFHGVEATGRFPSLFGVLQLLRGVR